MSGPTAATYDALLLLSFGGPEGPDDVMPFLRQVTRGRDIPEARLMEVAEHYHHFGGVSPINEHNRELLRALQTRFAQGPRPLPVYWGNRNWHPFVAETVANMKADGVRRALAFATSAYSSYSSCRQYLQDLEAAREHVGEGAPEIDKIRTFHNHPRFIEAQVSRIQDAMGVRIQDATGDLGSGNARIHFVFTAHSIPARMAETSAYESQLRDTCSLVMARMMDGHALGRDDLSWELAFQSRSGPPSVPWLEPDVLDALRNLAMREPGCRVVVVPVGFLSDHMEVMYDLDIEAQALARELGLAMIRVPTVGNHPEMVEMIVELVQERFDQAAPRRALGTMAPGHDRCSPECCAYSISRPTAPT
jgi:ferrochelatase